VFKILSQQAGINFIDTADIYSSWASDNPGGVSEQIIGKWMKKFDIPRDQVVIATKVRGQMGDGPNDQGLSRVHIFNAVDASLKRLKTDYIDLYQTHWYDEATPIEETLTALDDLVRQGKVRYIGASNYPAWRLMQSLWVADKLGVVRYATLQPHYNLANRADFERETAEVCRTYGIGVIPYSPLAGGFLSGKYRKDKPIPDSVRADGNKKRYFNDYGWKVLGAVEEVAANTGKSVSQIALAWQLSDEVITSPIIGPRTIAQLEDNLGAVGLRLTNEEKQSLDHASEWV
jgi:aryl-alcohol dehydrogenase-like predicted oxidoreductase